MESPLTSREGVGLFGRWSRKLLAAAFFALLTAPFLASAQPFILQGVNTNQFRVTTFATGLDFPLGMARLSDGSLLATISQGGNYFSSTGKLVRFVDVNQNGVADGPGTVLYSNLPGTLTAVCVASNLVFVTGQAKPITVLRTGAAASDPLTFVGRLLFTYPTGWGHPHSALRTRKTPGQTNRYDLLFQVGSDPNFAVSTRTVTFTNDAIPGANAILAGDSLYMLTIIDHGSNVSATNLTQVANGLRNPAGHIFHPATGDLYFEDNGIDGLTGSADPVSADELNFIARTNLGGPVEFFGFPTNYIAYRTGTFVGGAGIAPLVAFQPIPPSNGSESEGPNDVTFAPPGFPAGVDSGVFIGFHGRFSSGGTNNEENPLVYADPATGAYFHFILGKQPGIGHLDGLLATSDSLFVAELVTSGNPGSGAGGGVIYQIKSLAPTPPNLTAHFTGSQLKLSWDRGALQHANSLAGPWTDVTDAFSPQSVPINEARKFYRVKY